MKRVHTTLILILLVLIWGALAGGISLYIDSLWYDSVGYWQVFGITMTGRLIFFLAGFAVTFLLLGFNLWVSRLRPLGSYWISPEMVELARRGTGYLLWLGVAGLAIMSGLVTQGRWLMFLQYLHQVPAGESDPIFGRDIGFYLFSLPVYDFLVNFLIAAGVLSLLVAAATYVTHGHLAFERRLQLTQAAQIHLTILVALVFLLVAVRFWLNRFDVLYSEQGVVFGAGYTDIHAWLPCYWVLSILSVVTAVLFLVSIWGGALRLAAFSATGFVVGFLLLNFYPTFLQTFVVGPNELEKETPYIDNNITSTLQAYNLADIEVVDFSVDQQLTQQQVQQNEGTLSNIRLWDWRPLLDAYGQLQSIRLYYEFQDVDIDRYVVNGRYRQVMLSVRELDFSKISLGAQSWINKHIQYTHGYGLCMSPVNEVTAEGLPAFFLQDIPPRSSVDLQIERPEIYYGELTDYPVFVRTSLEEFDYPIGDTNATTTYQADRGLPINSLFMRLLFSWDLGIYQILFTDYFTPESRVLLHRDIRERVSRVADFLAYDQDPYMVIDEGRLVWVQDAYTVSSRYPYSEPFPARGTEFNYIRNAVKVAVDAYTGDITFYISDPSDPLIQVYARIFPDLFRPLEQMSEGLRQHLRYPADLFDVQRHIFQRYHMRDATVFYNQEDLWDVPTEIYRGSEQVMESYYVIMTLPGESHEEFILLIPYTPRNKDNMVAWLAARADGPNYGSLVLYQFPKQGLTFGPMQIEARIDQNPEISQLITLWSQKGSQVIRGNLLVIPIEQSILYVEPLYLQAEQSEIPELTRVIAVYGSRVAVGETLEEALRKAIFGGGAVPVERPVSIQTEGVLTGAPASIQDLIRRAQEHFDTSQSYLREGDWAAYGEEQRKLRDVLSQLGRVPED